MISLKPGPEDAVGPALLKVETDVGFTENDLLQSEEQSLSFFSTVRARGVSRE
tara:strand:+ start:21 stop:179 length:159 start_codon:yes stop_codon:yes gene_type:complete